MTDLSTLGVSSSGTWTRAQARRALSDGQIDARVRCGSWQVAWPGVYADGGYDLSAEQRAFAAVLASGGADQPLPVERDAETPTARSGQLRAVAFGRTAARVWGLPLVDDDDPATGRRESFHDDVATWRHLELVRHAGRTLHRHQPRFRPRDLARRPSGLWLTSPLRTLVDCRRLLRPDALVCALDHALHAKLVDAERLAAAAAGLKGSAGAPAFRAAVALADARAESPGETLTRLVLKPVLPGLVPQVELFDAAVRLVARFDLADEDVRLAVEFDGLRGHSGESMVAKDRRRDRRSEAFGWWTERVTWFEVRREQAELRRRMVARHAQLRAAPGRRSA